METYQILGVKFHSVTTEEALAKLESFLREDKPHLVVTLGPEMVMRAQEDEDFKSLVNKADLVVVDGNGILWAASRCGVKVPERIAGVELIEKFAQILSKRTEKEGLFLLGAAPKVAEKTGEELVKKYPGLSLAGTNDGYFKDNDPVLKKVKDSQAKVIYVALGSPRQEKWVRDYGEEAGIRIGVGVGGSFDVLSGLKKRAPQIFIKLRLEWFYRMLCEPSRWRRFLAIPRFMWLVFSKGRGAVEKWKEEDVN